MPHGGRNNAKTTDIESIDFGSRIWKTSSLFRLAYNKNDIQVGFCFSALKLESEKYGVYGAVYPLPEYLNRWYKHAFAFAELDKPEVVVFKMIDQYPGILFHIRRMCTDRPLYEEGFAVLAKTANEAREIQKYCSGLSEYCYKHLPEIFKSVQNSYGALGWQTMDNMISDRPWMDGSR